MIFSLIKSGYQKIKNALAKSGSLLGNKIRALFGGGKIDQETLDKLEQLLYEADLGVQSSIELTKKIQDIFKQNPKLDAEGIIAQIKTELKKMLDQQPHKVAEIPKIEGPYIILVVGVNGNGKTTTVAKLAKRSIDEGKKVLVAAADTFRAAATEQLEIWANRLQIDIVKGNHKSDPAAVAYDAIAAAKARGAEIVIIDTAGRLHTKTDLMKELEKIRRTCAKLSPHAPHETLLVLDATTGQNAVDQAKTFHQFTPITGLILTKLDGTAKGGIVISIQKQLGIPVKFIGVGETLEDFEPFDTERFVNALFD